MESESRIVTWGFILFLSCNIFFFYSHVRYPNSLLMMDCDIQILHSMDYGDLKSQGNVQVNVSSEFNRFKLPEEEDDGSLFTENQIEAIWKKRVSDNPKLYNGTKFRVHSVHKSSGNNGNVEINVGVTDYKTYLGTNWADNVKELQLLGSRLHTNSQAFLSEPLGVGSFLVLSDNYMVLLKRNFHCAEAPDTWDVPGGHAEPKNIVGDLPLKDIDASLMTGEQVCAEIFNSILQEITDEVNIPLLKLERPLYMGTARNTRSGGRPSLEFLIKCPLSSEDVHAKYHRGSQLEADESTNIKFVPLNEIVNIQRDDTVLWNNLAPSAKGCIVLYQMTHGLYTE